ncbi:SDR family NAD(P)-dependent oxidoreductase [Microbulbifer yueqingensis]|uniref:NAD(P)-dependent dehydrogenase, short-chain alcohol dehydrogenase family n=1 Tax=Microbulbifer yueqingensis TaxID=658219 RepID=A0A1G8ZCM3_9GAMM|nr:SDR family NAD(P)-dependent oxidoreductase [Microbulbifer yueqingensis]SDK12767.1 NAD(P)-dependent dehydrogenase, short-chain alcohol dehydrogenase family [Microbulbifer yueqingensis]
MKFWKHAIITGGGSGLGLGLALRLLRRGSCVSVLDLRLPEDARSQLDFAASEGGGTWQFQPVDVTGLAELQVAVDRSVSELGEPDLALNSAGIVVNRAFTELSTQDFHRVVDVNLHGSFHFAKAVMPHLQPGSRLALVASLAGLTSNYGYAAYGASKFGVVGLATTLRFEYQPLGIGVSCICPAEVRTPMVEKEKLDGDPVSMELRKVAGSLDVDTACDEILAGLDRGKWQIIPGTRGKLTALANRLFPGIFFRVCSLVLLKVLRRQAAAIEGS